MLLIADSGGTHTRALVATAQGKIIGSGRSGGANAFAIGKHAASVNLREALRLALKSASVQASRVSQTVIGTASVTCEGRGAAPIEDDLRSFLRNQRVRVVGDARIALEGALASEPGVVAVAGTGSIVLGRSSAGTLIRIGGWGPLAGDEGSGQWLGRRALQEAAHSADQVTKKTLLLDAICAHYRLRSYDDVLDVIYDHPMTSAELGALAPLVTAAADRGDKIARGILAQGAAALAAQVAATARRLKLKKPLVSHQGSMFNVRRRFQTPFAAELLRLLPQAQLIEPRLPPIGGAFLLALADAGVEASPTLIRSFREGCDA
jgi:N-acetylglucosamine kinase-like BadF-type ATPase